MHVDPPAKDRCSQGSSFMLVLLGANVNLIYLLIYMWTLINRHTYETLEHILVASVYIYIYINLWGITQEAGPAGKEVPCMPVSLGCWRLYLSIYLSFGEDVIARWWGEEIEGGNLVSFHIFFACFYPSSALDTDDIAAYHEAFVNYYLNVRVIVSIPKQLR